jgi:hypothetical protein
MSRQRLDVKQAAEVLGISSEGVRKRIKRGTLDSEKSQDGRVFVWLDGSDADRTSGPTRSDNGSHTNGATDRTDYGPGSDALDTSLQDQVSYLRTQLDLEREANRENRRLLAAALERIPAIESPRVAEPQAHSESREAPVTADEGTANSDVPPEQQEFVQRRSWLHRFFFGP